MFGPETSAAGGSGDRAGLDRSTAVGDLGADWYYRVDFGCKESLEQDRDDDHLDGDHHPRVNTDFESLNNFVVYQLVDAGADRSLAAVDLNSLGVKKGSHCDLAPEVSTVLEKHKAGLTDPRPHWKSLSGMSKYE